MFERFTTHARQALHLAVEEAARRGDRRVATDHILVGILHDAAIAQEVGADPDTARRVADQLGREALAAIGVDVSTYGPLAPGAPATNLPFTPAAKKVLERTLAHASRERARQVNSTHMLNALRECPASDPAAQLLARLGADPGTAHE